MKQRKLFEQVKYLFHNIVDSLSVEASAPQLQLLAWLGQSWCVERPQPQQLHKDSLVKDALSARSEWLHYSLLLFSHGSLDL